MDAEALVLQCVEAMLLMPAVGFGLKAVAAPRGPRA